MWQALVFDVDGTLADTEMAHLAAFNHAFSEAGLDWRWDVPLYTRLLEISGGKERIRAYWDQAFPGQHDISGNGLQQTIDRIHELKTAAYEQAILDGAVKLRDGVLPLIMSAHAAGMQLAIATTTSPVNISALLRKAIGSDWRFYFEVIEDAATAPRKKPDPSVYLQAVKRLNLSARQCLAFEDSNNGLRAALGAGLQVVITPNAFTAGHDFSGAFRILPDLGGTGLEQLQAWAAEPKEATV